MLSYNIIKKVRGFLNKSYKTSTTNNKISVKKGFLEKYFFGVILSKR